MDIMAWTFLGIGLVTLVTGLIVRRGVPAEEDFVLTKARLVHLYVHSGTGRGAEPYVELEVAGKPVQVSCQPLPAKHATDKVGDEVGVWVRRRKVLGLETVDAVLDKPEQLAAYIKKSKAAAGVLIGLGALLAVLGAVLGAVLL